jgi:hypothetical protein
MKATELRIGNYLMDDESDTLVVVSRIESIEYTNWNSGDEFNIVVLEYGTKERYLEGDFRPIPLTEEWLKKSNLNFEKLGYKSLGVSFGVTTLEIHFVIGNYYKKIKYLHELQNLYFEFTDEELTFKSEI